MVEVEEEQPDKDLVTVTVTDLLEERQVEALVVAATAMVGAVVVVEEEVEEGEEEEEEEVVAKKQSTKLRKLKNKRK